MKKSFAKRTVCQLLRTLKKSELRDFENYLIYRSKANTTKLWQRLKKEHPHFNLGDETVFKAVHPNKPYKDSAFRIWVADLYSAAKEYVAIQQFKEDKHLFNNTLALGLLWRSEETTYLKVQREGEKLYKEGQEKSVDLHLAHFQMEDLNYQYTTIFHHRAATNSLQKAANQLDISLLASKLKYLVVMRNRERITQETYDYELEQEILTYLEDKPRQDQPIIHLYFLLVKLFQTIDDKSIFEEFTSYFKIHKQYIERSEARQLLTFASNIAYWNIQLGNMAYLAMRFELIKIMVAEELPIIKGVYPSYHFSNIIRTAILTGETDWGTKFLEENIGKVSLAERQNLETFNRAYLHFAKEEYEKQAPYMLEMQATDYRFTDTQANISYRLLGIKTAYQQLAPTPSKSQLHDYKWQMNTFRLFIRELPDVSDDFRLSCKHFHQALSRIFRMNFGQRKVAITKKEIIEMQPIVELPWLLKRQ